MVKPKWLCRSLTDEGQKSIENAVIQAEKKTSAEIVPMIVRQSAGTNRMSLVTFCLFALVIVMHYFGGPIFHHPIYGPIFYVLIALAGCFSIWAHDQESDRQVHQRAELEFYKSGLNHTSARTGILVFISLLEHEVVVLADKAIADKLPADTWKNVVAMILKGIKEKNLAKGLVDGIAHCGEIVAPHFPISQGDHNELLDKLIIKE